MIIHRLFEHTRHFHSNDTISFFVTWKFCLFISSVYHKWNILVFNGISSCAKNLLDPCIRCVIHWILDWGFENLSTTYTYLGHLLTKHYYLARQTTEDTPWKNSGDFEISHSLACSVCNIKLLIVYQQIAKIDKIDSLARFFFDIMSPFMILRFIHKRRF